MKPLAHALIVIACLAFLGAAIELHWQPIWLFYATLLTGFAWGGKDHP